MGRSPGGGHGDHCSIVLAWRIPWTEEPGELWPIGLQRVGHSWSGLAHTACTNHYKETMTVSAIILLNEREPEIFGKLQETGRIKEKWAPAKATKEIYNYWKTRYYKAWDSWNKSREKVHNLENKIRSWGWKSDPKLFLNWRLRVTSSMYLYVGGKSIGKNISLSYWFVIDYCFLITQWLMIILFFGPEGHRSYSLTPHIFFHSQLKV